MPGSKKEGGENVQSERIEKRDTVETRSSRAGKERGRRRATQRISRGEGGRKVVVEVEFFLFDLFFF